jgi:hypothetical protein
MSWKVVPSSKLKNTGLWEMYEEAYREIGLIYEDEEKLLDYYKCSCYCYTDEDGIKAVILYWPSFYGNKIGLLFSDGTTEGKSALMDKLSELITTNGWYVELSGAPDHIMRNRKNIDNIMDNGLITEVLTGNNNTVKKAMNFEFVDDKGTYQRRIGQELHEKRLFGRPCPGGTVWGRGTVIRDDDRPCLMLPNCASGVSQTNSSATLSTTSSQSGGTFCRYPQHPYNKVVLQKVTQKCRNTTKSKKRSAVSRRRNTRTRKTLKHKLGNVGSKRRINKGKKRGVHHNLV